MRVWKHLQHRWGLNRKLPLFDSMVICINGVIGIKYMKDYLKGITLMWLFFMISVIQYVIISRLYYCFVWFWFTLWLLLRSQFFPVQSGFWREKSTVRRSPWASYSWSILWEYSHSVPSEPLQCMTKSSRESISTYTCMYRECKESKPKQRPLIILHVSLCFRTKYSKQGRNVQ